MGFTAENCLHRMYASPYQIHDPGDGKIILADRQLGICEMVSGASAETRTLYDPSKPGIRITLRLMTDGGGNVVVTAANGFNTALETSATFADAGDMLSLISVSLTASTYRWQVIGGQVGAAIASSSSTATSTATKTSTSTATATSTSTSTGTATSTSTSTATSTTTGTKETATATATKTATSTATKSATATATKTATATATKTSTATATATATGTQ